MAFDPSTAREFDPSSAVAFDASTAKEFDPNTAMLSKEESAKLPPVQIEMQEPEDNRRKFQSAVDAAPDETTFKKLTPSAATVLAAVDTITGTIGLPASWIVAARVYAQSGRIDQAYAALETTKEWSSVRTALQHYGKKLGLDETALEETLYEPNFIDNLFQWVDEKALEPAAKLAGYEENEDGVRGLGKHLLKDSIMLGAGPAAIKAIPRGKQARSGVDRDVQDILREKKAAEQPQKKAAEQPRPTEGVQGDLYPAKGEQFEMQFDDPWSTARRADEPVDRAVIDEEFSSRQGELPLTEQKGQMIGEDLFAPLNPARDVSMEGAKNPYLDPTAIKPEPRGQLNLFDPLTAEPVSPELPNIGTATATGLEQAGLPFALTGVREMRTFGGMSKSEKAALKKLFENSPIAYREPFKWDGEGNKIGRPDFGQGGWVKLPGGNFHPKVYEFFEKALVGGTGGHGAIIIPWANKGTKRYIDRYLGTERDPLKDVEIPYEGGTIRWEEAVDRLLNPVKAKEWALARFADQPTGLGELAKKNPEADVWGFNSKPSSSTWASVKDFSTKKYAIENYLHHVQDYVRQHVPIDQLDRYDFVRAVRETVEQDKRQAKLMESAISNQEINTVVKDYSDYRWVEVGKETELTPKQAKTIREINKDVDGGNYQAFDVNGNPIIRLNPYGSKEPVYGRTPVEAYNNGLLATEGNVMGHCVGGYCEAVRNGESRIFSLRDKKGNAHVTIEVLPMERSHRKYANAEASADEIVQIKGKQNRKPNPEYIKYVQDFVKTQKMDVRGDLHNTELFTNLKNGSDWPQDIVDTPYQGLSPEILQKYLPDDSGYYTKQEMIDAADKWLADSKGSTTKLMRSFGFTKEDKLGRFLPRFFSSSPESVKEGIDKMVSPYKSISELAKEQTANAASGFKSEGDISPFFGQLKANTITVNQLPMVMESPTITLLVNRIKEAEMSKHQHAYDIAAKLHQFEKLAGNVKIEHKALAVIEELQKKQYQDFGKAAGIPEATDTQLIALGLSPEQIGAFRMIREINEDVNKIRTEGRLRLGVKEPESPVWSYHPKSYGVGDKMLSVWDKKTGALVWHHKWTNFADMKAAKKEWIKSLTDQNEIHNFEIESRANAKDWQNPFTNLDQSKLPEVVQRIMATIEEKIETRDRTFEMERVGHDIKGLIQYEGKKPDPLLKEVWLSYIEMVLNFDKHSRLFEVQRDLLDNSWYYKDKGSLYDFSKTLLQGELGQNTTWKPFQGVEQGLTWSHNKIARGVEKLKGTEVLADDFVATPGGVRKAANYSAAMASAATLLGNVPNALLNLSQIPLTGVFSIPFDIMTKLRANPLQTVKWTIETNVEFGRAMSELVYTLETGKATDASKALDMYVRNGQVRAMMFDEIALAAEGYSHSISRQIAKGMNFGKKWTNDLLVEMPTNAVSLLYYDILIHKVAKDHLINSGVTKAQRDMLPIVLAKSWVGDYARSMRPEGLKKSGAFGASVSNFINWPTNQWGRFTDAIQNLKPEQGKAIYPQLGSFVGMWYVYSQLAGGKNAPIAATWDSIRQSYNEYAVKNDEDLLPDLDYYAKEYGVPNWAFPQDTWIDKAQRGIGIENPIDLSSGQKFAHPLQISTLTPEFYWSLGKTIKLGMKMLAGAEAWSEDETKPVGVTRKEILGATNKMPHILKGYLNEKYARFDRPDGSKAIVSRFDKLAFTQQNETEEFMNKLGIKSTRQREERKEIAHNTFYATKLANQPKKLKEHIMSQVTQYLAGDKSFADLITIEENMMRLKNLNPQWDKNLEQELIDKYGRMTDLPEEAILRAASKDVEAARLLRLKKMWDRLGLYD